MLVTLNIYIFKIHNKFVLFISIIVIKVIIEHLINKPMNKQEKIIRALRAQAYNPKIKQTICRPNLEH